MAVADGSFSAIFWFWALGNITLGSALFIEKKISTIASGLLIIWGVLMVLLHLAIGIDDFPQGIGLVIFLGAPVVTIILGFFILRSEC